MGETGQKGFESGVSKLSTKLTTNIYKCERITKGSVRKGEGGGKVESSNSGSVVLCLSQNCWSKQTSLEENPPY